MTLAVRDVEDTAASVEVGRAVVSSEGIVEHEVASAVVTTGLIVSLDIFEDVLPSAEAVKDELL